MAPSGAGSASQQPGTLVEGVSVEEVQYQDCSLPRRATAEADTYVRIPGQVGQGNRAGLDQAVPEVSPAEAGSSPTEGSAHTDLEQPLLSFGRVAT